MFSSQRPPASAYARAGAGEAAQRPLKPLAARRLINEKASQTVCKSQCGCDRRVNHLAMSAALAEAGTPKAAGMLKQRRACSLNDEQRDAKSQLTSSINDAARAYCERVNSTKPCEKPRVHLTDLLLTCTPAHHG
jgi:outer membrane PBP1 activator LpoA protein